LGFCAALFFGPLAIVPAAAQQSDLQTVLDRLDRVQRELNTLQRQVYQGRRPPAPATRSAPGRSPASAPESSPLAARLQVKLDEIEVQIRGLTGKFEELNHNNNQLRARLDKLAADNDLRFSAIEKRAAAASAGTGAGAGTQAPAPGVVGGVPGDARSQALPGGEPPGALGTIPAGEAQGPGSTAVAKASPAALVLPAGTPEEQYRFAYKLLIQTDYVDAENAFRAFVTAHPDHKLAGNAHYWLGETYYVRNDYNSAARTFAEGYRKFPKSAKGPDNLLKLGLSLARLGSKQDACATFARLSKEFPKAPANIIGRAKAERKNNDCK
jgi:tol-pal system protein YbgF